MKEKKQAYKQIFDYQLLIQKKVNMYQVSIVSLNLFSNGKNLEEAMTNLESEFLKLKLNYKNFGMLEQLNNKRSNKYKNSITEKTLLFALKTSTIAIVFVISFVFLTSVVVNKLNQISLVEIIKSESNKMKGFFPDEKQNLLKLRDLVESVKPYIKELKKINQ